MQRIGCQLQTADRSSPKVLPAEKFRAAEPWEAAAPAVQETEPAREAEAPGSAAAGSWEPGMLALQARAAGFEQKVTEAAGSRERAKVEAVRGAAALCLADMAKAEAVWGATS